jgi:Ca2+-binding RTX toxin-like protein
MIGSALNDALTGSATANRLVGGAGNDTLVGGLGNDTLTGAAGLDFIVFDAAPSATNRDTISGFVRADDTIQLAGSVFTALGGPGGISAGAFNVGAAASQTDDRIIYNAANGALLYDADGLGGVAGIQIATISGLTGALGASDFVVI